jgi:hypothetical protein
LHILLFLQQTIQYTKFFVFINEILCTSIKFAFKITTVAAVVKITTVATVVKMTTLATVVILNANFIDVHKISSTKTQNIVYCIVCFKNKRIYKLMMADIAAETCR